MDSSLGTWAIFAVSVKLGGPVAAVAKPPKKAKAGHPFQVTPSVRPSRLTSTLRLAAIFDSESNARHHLKWSVVPRDGRRYIVAATGPITPKRAVADVALAQAEMFS